MDSLAEHGLCSHADGESALAVSSRMPFSGYTFIDVISINILGWEPNIFHCFYGFRVWPKRVQFLIGILKLLSSMPLAKVVS